MRQQPAWKKRKAIEHSRAGVDLDLGWAISKRDLDQGWAFVRHPYTRRLAELDVRGWLDSIAQSIRDGTYAPKPMSICDVPKGNWAVRPGSMLALEDAVVYTAATNEVYETIYRQVTSLDPPADFAYQLRPPADRSTWFQSQYRGWRRFRNARLARLDDGAAFVVVADVAGYYEHIDT